MQLSVEHLVAFLLGSLLSCFLLWFLFQGKISAGQIERAVLAEKLHAQERHGRSLLEQIQTAKEEMDELDQQADELLQNRAELKTALEAERRQSEAKLGLLLEARESLTHQFKSLASEILDEKTRKFTEQNQVSLGHLLSPLRQQITDFKSKVEEVYVNEGKDRSALSEQVKHLLSLNASLSTEAHNLTLALKGESKTQGNWGEILLEDVLQRAGLQPGLHYLRQPQHTLEHGKVRLIPDVVINLPGERHLVVDSKMTLPDYSLFSAASDPAEKSAALKRHLTSLRSHIKDLSEKNYQTLYGVKTLDFVILFVPLEPAFMTAVTNDPELFQRAWERNVLLVSPSTLLFVVRTVANLWQQADQNRNAQEIAQRGGELYDKFCAFVADLDEVQRQLHLAQKSFDTARRKLHTGKGNLIQQAETLRALGVKPNKLLPEALREKMTQEPE